VRWSRGMDGGQSDQIPMGGDRVSYFIMTRAVTLAEVIAMGGVNCSARACSVGIDGRRFCPRGVLGVGA
jgi:hypothetical protein